MRQILLLIPFIFTVFIFQSCESEKPLNPKRAIITGLVSNLDKHKIKESTLKEGGLAKKPL